MATATDLWSQQSRAQAADQGTNSSQPGASERAPLAVQAAQQRRPSNPTHALATRKDNTRSTSRTADSVEASSQAAGSRQQQQGLKSHHIAAQASRPASQPSRASQTARSTSRWRTAQPINRWQRKTRRWIKSSAAIIAIACTQPATKPIQARSSRAAGHLLFLGKQQSKRERNKQ